jgi:hypothetical protein
MTLESTILRDLQAGQSTADAIALRAERSTGAVMATLTRLMSEGKVTSKAICDGRLTVYLLKL